MIKKSILKKEATNLGYDIHETEISFKDKKQAIAFAIAYTQKFKKSHILIGNKVSVYKVKGNEENWISNYLAELELVKIPA